jgi:transposase-like protein
LSKISPAGYRFPAPAEGVQVNFCKNVRCAAFGVPETLHRTKRPAGATPEPGDYTRHGMTGATLMKCGVCGGYMPVRSNQAVVEELQRLSAHMRGKPASSCPNDDCANVGKPVTEKGLYARFGKTKVGTPRWRCNACRKTFSEVGAPQLRQRKTHKNRDVFLLLVNKSPLRRIAEVTGLSADALYGKISFIHRQCLAFAGQRELQMLQGMPLPKMYLAVDRQAHNVNWSNRKDRRNVVLTAVGSADLGSGYVFGFHLNFDSTLDPAAVERDAATIGDAAHYEAFRHYARLWLAHDYNAAVATTVAAAATKWAKRSGAGAPVDRLTQEISSTYEDAALRVDVEASEKNTADMALPARGMQVREQYTLHGHFQLLASLLRGAKKVRLYMDQDSGIRGAFLGAFAERIKERTADGWYVTVLKESTIHQKERAVQLARARLADAADRFPGVPAERLVVELMKEEMSRATTVGVYGDQWLDHPVPNMSEPAKKVCWLTDMGDYDTDHAAHLYLKASLHAVDRFFMQTRRLLSLAERSIVTASKDRRVWHGYSAYKPENLAKVLEIFRVYYNYCKVGKDKRTPAMRLGLARAPVPIEDVLYFDAASGRSKESADRPAPRRTRMKKAAVHEEQRPLKGPRQDVRASTLLPNA